jgi:glycosyltransferase involved in cell wall biosynthesis
MKFLLVTDAWRPQVNGVVRTWEAVTGEMRSRGIEVEVIHPGLFRSFAAPKYPEIKLAILPGAKVRRMIRESGFDAIHIATEGPLGMAAVRHCRRQGIPYTTSYHTRFPEYMKSYFGLPVGITDRFLRWFHGPAQATLVPTKSMRAELAARRFDDAKLVTWCRGVDTATFKPEPKVELDLPRPIFAYAGRIAVEKNLEAFLSLDLPGSKMLIGDGPARPALAKKYPDVHFAGYRFGEELAATYAAADVFVFPSLTDTFGVVMLEANACGLPVAAFPVTGPIDVVIEGRTGALDADLRAAALRALDVDRQACVDHARSMTWARCADMVLENLACDQPALAAALG